MRDENNQLSETKFRTTSEKVRSSPEGSQIKFPAFTVGVVFKTGPVGAFIQQFNIKYVHCSNLRRLFTDMKENGKVLRS